MGETGFKFRYYKRNDFAEADEFYTYEADYQSVSYDYVKAKYETFDALSPVLWDSAIAALNDVQAGQDHPIPALSSNNISNDDKDAILEWLEINDELDLRYQASDT